MAKLFVCGDIVNQTPNYDFVSKDLARIISNADFSVCNFEGPELAKGQQATFPHQESGTASYLKSIGFNLMLLANNHITEQGADGIKRTIATIKTVGCDCIGAGLSWEEAYQPIEKIIAHQRLGFINVCEAQVGQYISKEQPYGYAWMGYENLLDDVSKLRERNNHVIVFVHAGLEHYDVPLPEIRELYRKICDSGATAVIGGHPHCAQGWEKYKDSLIVYSLGNFFFPLRERWSQESHSYSIELECGENGNIDITPIFHHNTGNCVELDDNATCVNIKKLNSKLEDNYSALVKGVIQDSYNNLCKRLLIQATCGQNEKDGWKTIVRKVLNYTIYRSKNVLFTKQKRDSLLLRLFENETYRWIIIRYLKNRSDYDKEN